MPSRSPRARRTRRPARPPGRPWRVQVDGSYHWPTACMYYAAVIYDPSGTLRLRRLGCQDGGSSAEAEARALLLGACAIRELLGARPPAGWRLLSDHRGLVDALNGPGDLRISADIRPYAAETHALLAGGDVAWIPRERNFSAHWTAEQRHLAARGLIVDLQVDEVAEQAARRAATIAQARTRLRFGDPRVRAKARRQLVALGAA